MIPGMFGAPPVQLAAVTAVDATVFAIAAFFVLVGAVGVVVAPKPRARRSDARAHVVRRCGAVRGAAG